MPEPAEIPHVAPSLLRALGSLYAEVVLLDAELARPREPRPQARRGYERWRSDAASAAALARVLARTAASAPRGTSRLHVPGPEGAPASLSAADIEQLAVRMSGLLRLSRSFDPD